MSDRKRKSSATRAGFKKTLQEEAAVSTTEVDSGDKDDVRVEPEQNNELDPNSNTTPSVQPVTTEVGDAGNLDSNVNGQSNESHSANAPKESAVMLEIFVEFENYFSEVLCELRESTEEYQLQQEKTVTSLKEHLDRVRENVCQVRCQMNKTTENVRSVLLKSIAST